jgi:hypothetical protein
MLRLFHWDDVDALAGTHASGCAVALAESKQHAIELIVAAWERQYGPDDIHDDPRSLERLRAELSAKAPETTEAPVGYAVLGASL